MLVKFMSPLLGIAALSACTVSEPAGVSRLQNDLSLSGGRYTSGGGISVALETREQAGRTLVCGVWAQSKRQSILTKNVEGRLLGTGSAYLDDEILVRGLGFLPEVAPSENYSGNKANCVLTDRPWHAGDENKELEGRFPRQVVHRESGDIGGGGFEVYFIPGGPEA